MYDERLEEKMEEPKIKPFEIYNEKLDISVVITDVNITDGQLEWTMDYPENINIDDIREGIGQALLRMIEEGMKLIEERDADI